MSSELAASRDSSSGFGPLAARLTELLSAVFGLGDRRLTATYWGAVGFMLVGLAVPRLLPMVDYPQHLGVADVIRRMMEPGAIENQQFSVDWFTYNALCHLLIAVLGNAVPIETAGRLVVACALVGYATMVVALLEELGRPRAYALLLVPTFFSFSHAWGFVNYTLGTVLALATLLSVLRSVRAPSAAAAIVTATLALLCGFTHVLATLVLCVLSAATVPEQALRHARGWRALRRGVLAMLPLGLACAYCTAVFLHQYGANPGSYQDATLEGKSPGVLFKIVQLGAYTTGAHWDQTDNVLVWLSCGVMIAASVHAFRSRVPGQRRRGPLGPLLAMGTAYLAVPEVFIGTHLVFPRLGQLALLGAVIALPTLAPGASAKLRTGALVIAGITGLNFFGHCVWHAVETDGASRVLDAMPPRRRAAAVVYDPTSRAFQSASLVHWAGYYGARRDGQWAFNFARFSSVPLDFREAEPPWPHVGWEFAPELYNPRCAYARAYDLLLVAAPRNLAEAPEERVRALVFGPDAATPKLLARDGRYFAFDTRGIPSDGTR
jgi:hypothetical protein